MSILYSIAPNPLTNGANTYRAVVHPYSSVDEAAMIERIMIERGSTITRSDILAVLQEYHAATLSLVLEGFKVNTPLAHYTASIKGVFASQFDNFDPNRHSVNASVWDGCVFHRAIREQSRVQKLEGSKPAPLSLDYEDANSGQTNATLTPGGMGRVLGRRLKFDPDDPNQGIFLTVGNNGDTPVWVNNGTLQLGVPGSLTALFGQSDIRSGTLEATLYVA